MESIGNVKAEKALRCIKAIVDSWYNDTLVIVGNNEQCDPLHRIWMIDSVMGTISNHLHEGLGLDIPVPKYLFKRMKGGK